MVFNGIDATSGHYLLPPLSPAALTAIARGQVTDASHLKELASRHHRTTEDSFAPKEGVDPKNLAEAGWGVIFAHGADPAVREALDELLDHRREQASLAAERRYREFTGPDAYRPGESKQKFLARHGAGPGPVDPDVVPYYLLIVGDPTAIPYEVQYQLDVQYAVGRIHFDRLDDYAAYAHSVVTCERGGVAASRRITFFGTQNGDDPATALSATQLVGPLAETVGRENDGWSVETFLGEAATKRRLLDLAGGPGTPALLFTGTHGAGFPSGHPLQLSTQGALVCQEWPGPTGQAVPLGPDQYFSAADLGDDARLLGLIAFHFACFGAGTPQRDSFSHAMTGEPPELAPHPFVASLPKRALAHPNGGALAVVGHVDRAWGYSFSWPQAGRQTEVYRSCLTRLLAGHPIGSAFEYFNQRYAEMSTELSALLEKIEFGRAPDHLAVSSLWTANNDARGFTIIGDPAVRLPVGSTDARVAPGPARLALRSPPPEVPRGAEVDEGPDSRLLEHREALVVALGKLAETLSGMVQRIVDELPLLEVATYASDDPSEVRFDPDVKRFTDADLRLLTRIALDGSTSHVVGPPRGGDEEPLWDLHLRMVEQARAARLEFLREVVAALSSARDALGGAVGAADEGDEGPA